MRSSNRDTVLCRSLGDEPLVRIAYSATEAGLLISTQESFHPGEEDGEPVTALAVRLENRRHILREGDWPLTRGLGGSLGEGGRCSRQHERCAD